MDKPAHYLDVYERYWANLRQRPVKVLEVGVNKGGSLQLWRDYFPSGKIYGIDCNPECAILPLGERIEVFTGDQSCPEELAAMGIKLGRLDIVIDDASHFGHLSLKTFLALFPAVAPGGMYAIEDWGTGYWADWPDGSEVDREAFAVNGKTLPSHQSGMVGFVKQLVDLFNTRQRDERWSGLPIASMELMRGLVLLRKMDEPSREI